jgi:hypothetical protein
LGGTEDAYRALYSSIAVDNRKKFSLVKAPETEINRLIKKSYFIKE